MLHYPLQAYIHLAVPPVHDNGHSKMFNKQNNPLNRWYRAQSSLLNIDWCSPKLKVSTALTALHYLAYFTFSVAANGSKCLWIRSRSQMVWEIVSLVVFHDQDFPPAFNWFFSKIPWHFQVQQTSGHPRISQACDCFLCCAYTNHLLHQSVYHLWPGLASCQTYKWNNLPDHLTPAPYPQTLWTICCNRKYKVS